MPLSFDCLSHGTVAFGFFNIASDMLLLDRYFFFATEFCEHVGRAAKEAGRSPHEQMWQAYRIDRPEDAGDLTAAIYGIYYQGFIGELYRLYPFPKDPQDFKQRPEGHAVQSVVRGLIGKYAEIKEIPFILDEERTEIAIGEYRFTKDQFHALLRYVWRGGYPRWREEIRPEYVQVMRKRVEESRDPLFEGIRFDHP